MKAKIDPKTRINLNDAVVLLLEGTQHALDVLSQILHGFGVRDVQRCLSVEEAEKVIARKQVDLIIVEPELKDAEDGLEFVKRLRRSGQEPNAYAPVIVIHGHVRRAQAGKMRDAGANFVVAKPITPHVLLQRILWVAADKRPFAEDASSVGPDRRFKFAGPPVGLDGRRDSDLTTPLGQAEEPNMSQSEIDGMLKPQRVAL